MRLTKKEIETIKKVALAALALCLSATIMAQEGYIGKIRGESPVWR